MSVLLRLCGSLVVLAPPLVLAATLETPGNGDNLSGIGVIRGWKCETVGEITVVIDGGGPIPMAYGNDRTDTQGPCGDSRNGFVSIINWGEFSTGEHTAVAYDNGVEFARSTFTVVRASEEESYLRDVTAECTVPDFPDAGTNASFEWNQGTQHLELAEVGEDVAVPVSTQFDGEWTVVFQETGHPLGLEPLCSGGRNKENAGVFRVQNGVVVAANITIEGDRTSGLKWFGIITPGGSLEGSWIFPRESDWITVGSWDGILDDIDGFGNWFHGCGLYGYWEAKRREDS